MNDLTDGSQPKHLNPWWAGGAALVFLLVAVWVLRLSSMPTTPTSPTGIPPTVAGSAAPVVSRGTNPATSTTTVRSYTTTTAGPQVTPANRAAAQSVTLAFIQAWQTPGNPADRTRAMQPYATTELINRVADVPSEVLPQAKPAVVTITTIDQLTATARFTLEDGLVGECDLVRTAAGYRVNEIRRAN